MRKSEIHRLPKREKQRIAKTAGLGSALGRGFPEVRSAFWSSRNQKWEENRIVLESQFPQIFSKKHFSSLKFLGGRGEGEVREFLTAEPFTSSSGLKWYALAIKKFHKHSRSNPRNQAEALHSLNLMLNYFKHNNMIRAPFEPTVSEPLAFKGPFLVMRHLAGPNEVRADKLPPELQKQVFDFANKFSKAIYFAEKSLINRFEAAGLHYPSPDFVPSNFVATVKGGRIVRLWIIDQFKEPVRSKEPRYRRHSHSRISDKWKLGNKIK